MRTKRHNILRDGEASGAAVRSPSLGRRHLLWISVAASVGVLFLPGCLSPTLPLPPPSAPLVSAPDEGGNIKITGRVQSRASVFVRNARTNKGVNEQTGDSGRYDLEMKAEIGDTLSIWQRVGTHESESIEIAVPETDPIETIPPPPDGMGGMGNSESD